MQGKIIGQSGGSKINGIIEEYKVASGGNVNAGDFVEYLNKINIGTDTQLSDSDNTGYVISAVALNENKVFIAHTYGSNYYLYGIVCTIVGDTITAGEDININASKKNAISVVGLNEYKVLITYVSDGAMSSIICTINDTTISIGTSYQIYYAYGANRVSTVKLTENKIFIAYCGYSSNYYLYGRVCEIEGDTITVGDEKQLSYTKNTGMYMSVAKLVDNKVFIAHTYGSNYYLYGIVCTINGTKITTGEDTELINSSTAYGTNNMSYISTIQLAENKVFIVHLNHTSNYLAGMICTIEGTTITAGTDTQLSIVDSTSCFTTSIVKLAENKIFIAYCYSGSYRLYRMVCTINGNIIEVVEDTKLSTTSNSGYTISIGALSEDKVFIAHSGTNNYQLYAMLNEYQEGVTPVISSSQTIHGVARTKGTEGQTVKVYVPNIVEEEN